MKKTNLVGKRFGRLLVISPAESRNGLVCWNCQCDCGKSTVAIANSLREESTKSCGCLKREILQQQQLRVTGKPSHNFINLKGQRFGKLVVIASHASEHNRARWICKCDCGKTCIATGKTLRENKKKSCGCLYNLVFLKQSLNDFPASMFLYNQYKKLALKRNYVFELTIDEFRNLTLQNCTYCDLIPKQIISNYAIPYIYNGIDRVDNNRGYTINNCVPCCKFCNQAKSNRTLQDFLESCQRVAQHQNSKTLAEMTNDSE
jgi:hypothetical protein